MSEALAGFAQGLPRVHRIGYLGSESESYEEERLRTLRAGLHDLGYVEGRNYAIEGRFAKGDYSRLPELAAQLVALKVDLIVTSGSKAGVAATNATRSVPIVVSNMGDAINSGVVAGYGQPGGNVTGMSMMNPEMLPKQIEILKQLKPGAKAIALMLNPANPNARLIEEVARREARRVNATLEPIRVKGPQDFEAAFQRLKQRHVDCLVVSSDTMFAAYSGPIAQLARSQRIVSVGTITYAQAGGVAGYSSDRLDAFRQIAVIIDKILKGAKPFEIPVEQPRKIELIVNMKAAKELGLDVPRSVLLAADSVIE